MRFNQVFFENANKNLKRVRIKVDPRHASYENYKSINYYEGYILEENAQFLRIMVIKPGTPVVQVPQDILAEHTPLDNFKINILKCLQILDSDPAYFNIVNAVGYEDLEAVLKTRGLTDAEICNLYREFIKKL